MTNMTNNTMTNSMTNNTMTNNTMTNNTMTNSMTNNTMANTNTMTNTNNIREGCSAIIDNLSDISIKVISMVVDMLDTAIRKVDRVGSHPGSSSIIRFCLVEPCSRVVISHSIGVLVGRDFS